MDTTHHFCWECATWDEGLVENASGEVCANCDKPVVETVEIPAGEPLPRTPGVGEFSRMAVVTAQDGNRLICAHRGREIAKLVQESLWWGDQEWQFDDPSTPDPDGIWVWEGWVQWIDGGYFHPYEGDFSITHHKWRRPTTDEMTRFATGGLMFGDDA